MSNSTKRFSSLIKDLWYLFINKKTKRGSIAANCCCLIHVLALWERFSLLPISKKSWQASSGVPCRLLDVDFLLHPAGWIKFYGKNDSLSNYNHFIREYFRSRFMQQKVLSDRSMWSWCPETAQLCNSVAGEPGCAPLCQSWCLHKGTWGHARLGMRQDELSLSISSANLDLFFLLMKPYLQTLRPCFSSLCRQIALPYENTLSNMRWSNTKVMGNTEVLKWINRECCS